MVSLELSGKFCFLMSLLCVSRSASVQSVTYIVRSYSVQIHGVYLREHLQCRNEYTSLHVKIRGLNIFGKGTTCHLSDSIDSVACCEEIVEI